MEGDPTRPSPDRAEEEREEDGLDADDDRDLLDREAARAGLITIPEANSSTPTILKLKSATVSL